MKKKMSKCLIIFLKKYYEGENLDKPNFEEKKSKFGTNPKKIRKITAFTFFLSSVLVGIFLIYGVSGMGEFSWASRFFMGTIFSE